VRGRGPELHRLFEAVDGDAPSSERLVSIAYEEWRAYILDQPDLDHEASFVVLAPDGRAVAFSWLLVDREGHRAAVEMTGTLREFRRRGLARMAKLATIRWAAEHGVTTMVTGNDAENRPMLALNEELGFEPRIVHQDFVKELR
jgi:GNAT superfamily N-acetyltransferase